MTGVVLLLFLILNQFLHFNLKDCYKFYLKKYLKIPDGFLMFISTYTLSLLVLYIAIGVFMLIFHRNFEIEYFLEPQMYFYMLTKF